jgi:hypothetical protein
MVFSTPKKLSSNQVTKPDGPAGDNLAKSYYHNRKDFGWSYSTIFQITDSGSANAAGMLFHLPMLLATSRISMDNMLQ